MLTLPSCSVETLLCGIAARAPAMGAGGEGGAGKGEEKEENGKEDTAGG